jgi:type IX secretion system PorP/SprF family membrane protein
LILLRKYIILGLFSLLLLNGNAQDIHFSQYDLSPINLNPAMTGQFNGDFRFIGNYRSQWGSVTVPFNTISIGADAKNIFNTKDLAGGIQINQDRAGDSKFNTFQVNFSGAYLKPISNDSLHNLSFGIQTGFTNRSLTYNPLSFDVQYNGSYYDENLPNQENFARESRTYLNLNLGVGYLWEIEKRKTIRGGLALFNLTKPKQSFFNDDEIKLDMRLAVHANAEWKVHEKINVLPSMLFMSQGKYKELDFGVSAKYILTDFMSMYRTVWLGLFYRNQDAGFLTAGMDYDQWKVGVSYDINVSTLVPASNNRGGLEISVIYIIDNTPPKRIMHRICPDYI